MCIDSAARQNVESCPANAPPPSRRGGPGAAGASAPESHLVETKRRQEETKQGPTGPSVELSRRELAGLQEVQSRALALLQREVTTLERIVGRMRDNDPQGAEYLMRLATTYFELQTHFTQEERGFDERVFQANGSQREQLERQQAQSRAQATEARQAALRTYARLLQDYPDFQRRDEVLFSLAFGLEEMRQFDRARQVYFELIKAYPNSRFIPHAYLSFAEYYFGQGEMENAQRFYTKVTEFPPEQNPVYGYALYKQAWAAYNVEDFRGALGQFVRTIEFATANPDARDAANLARQSRRELVLPYSHVGRPNEALDFFRRYAESREQAYDMLESLAELYYDTGQWPETIAVYRRLMSENTNSDKICYWQGRVTNAYISSRPKAEQLTEVQRLIDIFNVYRQGTHAENEQGVCKSTVAATLVELATAWHRETVGVDAGPEQQQMPGTNDQGTMRQAAQVYRLVLDTFPDLDGIEFPQFDQRDKPTRYRVSYFYAELLWRLDDWEQCGPAFDQVVELEPQGEFTADAAYAAVLCYNNLYQQTLGQNDREVRSADQDSNRGRRGRRGRRGQQEEEAAPNFQPRDFTPTEQGMVNAFTRFICFVPDSDELPSIKYRRARIYYETNHFSEAAEAFKDIAWNHRDSEVAEFAANLYLDSLNTLGTQMGEANPACINEIESSLEPLYGFYCNGASAQEEHSDLCPVVIQLRCDVVRLRAETLARAGDHRGAAEAYRNIVQNYRECGRLEEVIYNLAIEYEASRLLGRAIRARTTLIQRFPEHPLAKRAVYLVGANYHALAIYSQAADWYERFARDFPGAEFPIAEQDRNACTEEERNDPERCAVAYVGLENAVFFRLGLGEEDKAIEDTQLYERNYRRSRPRETSQVVFSLGSIYERRGDWEQVFNHYRNFLRDYGRRALPHEVIRANVQMGRAKWETDDKREAERYFRAATQAFQRGAVEAIRQAEGTDAEKELWLARARDATSEALFYLAEYKFAEFREIRFPRVPSTRNIASVTSWSQGELMPWLERKRQALVAAEQAYNEIAPLEIPQWQIAAAARIGEMYQTIVDQMRGSPIPTEIENDDELYGIYVDALEGALNGSGPGPDGRPFTADDVACTPDSQEPQCVNSPVRQAMSKFEFCLTLATRVRWFNEFSQQCEVQLNRLDAARYPLAAELRGTASFVQDQIAHPEPVELQEEGEEDNAGAAEGDRAVTGGAS